jgi:hypothetical protein
MEVAIIFVGNDNSKAVICKQKIIFLKNTSWYLVSMNIVE